MIKITILLPLLSILFLTCEGQNGFPYLEQSSNSLNYIGTPVKATDRNSLVYSDKGAWFGYGFPNSEHLQCGFSGPFLMTEQNGVWLSSSFSPVFLNDENNAALINWQTSLKYQSSYHSHLEQFFQNEKIAVKQQLFFISGHTSIQRTIISNTSSTAVSIYPSYQSKLLLDSLTLTEEEHRIKITSLKTEAKGYIGFSDLNTIAFEKDGYSVQLKKITLKPKESYEMWVSHTFIFPEYSWSKEKTILNKINLSVALKQNKLEKEKLLSKLITQKKDSYKHTAYSNTIAKVLLTLQNNTRIAAGGLKYAGVFPSYHYLWFHGYWAWDSWKHAAALSKYEANLAKDQMLVMFHLQQKDGFIPDCIFRDTIVEKNNYRNSKPPLAAWATWCIYKNTEDKNFLKEIYPKLKKYHDWWYSNRDHDKDGLCEFGSTDGTIVAAKWESGMDNAVRYDGITMLRNDDKAYSMDHESVDLNSFLYAEKLYLRNMAIVLGENKETEKYQRDAESLKHKIQYQFWDDEMGWFFDSSLDGKTLFKDMGCEGYIPLWAGVASSEQAKKAKENMMNISVFNTYVPLPTLAANHPKFKPERGYWRGPVWLDQSYFGIIGLEKYGYRKEADELSHKLLHHAEGVMQPGEAIRENYHPITGKGLESYNFSWSAAHIMMLILKNE
ncbi:MAG: trehalase family glycosidase [Sediminibacterium sp.]|nr:trehalase family glycosidase [Sediminibacterium sp.]